MRLKKLAIIVAASAGLVAATVASPAQANHSWNGYHWATSNGVVSLQLVSSLTPDWTGALSTANSDWNVSTHLNNTVVAGDTSSRARKRCVMTAGQVHVCNATYGNTSWAGIASINLSGGHISQGSAKMNDTYLGAAVAAKRQGVMCQEVGHTFGLAHQDENFTNPNLGTCMDYTNDWSTNQHPNAHDYDELNLIYNHSDLAVAAATSQAGKSVVKTGNTITVITWAS